MRNQKGHFYQKRLKILLLNAFSICLFFYLLPVFFTPLQLVAKGNGVIRITVTSAVDGGPLVGANVLLFDYDNSLSERQPSYYCVTNRDGFCEIRNLTTGKVYVLRITFIGHQPYQGEIVVNDGEIVFQRIELVFGSEDLNELVVKQERYITTGEAGIQRISSQDISLAPSPGTGGDLASFLQSIPGILSSGDRGGEYFIRGGTPDQNLVLVDGLPVVKPFHISNLFSAFSDEVVEFVDLYAGGHDASFDGAASAVLDIGLRQGNMKEFSTSVAASPYLMSLHVEGPIKKDQQSLLVSGRQSVIENVGPYITSQKHPIRFSDLIARYTIIDEAVSCNITGIYTQDEGEIVPNRNLDHYWSNSVIGARCLGYSEAFNNPVEFTIGYTSFINYESIENNRERSNKLSQKYFRIQFQKIGNHFTTKSGFGLNFRRYDIALSERFTQFISVDNISKEIPAAHFFISTEWSKSQKFAAQSGISSRLTLDHIPTFEPRIRLSWSLWGNNQSILSLALGKYTQIHSGISNERDIGSVFKILKPAEPNDPLQSSLHTILNYDQKFGQSFESDIELFFKSDDHIAVSKWTPEARTEIETTFATAQTYGLDLRVLFDKNPVMISVGYGWAKITYQSKGERLGAWLNGELFNYSPAHDQRHKVNVLSSYNVFGFNLRSNWELSTGTPYTQIFGFDFFVNIPSEVPQIDPGTARLLYNEPFGERLPVYHRLDLSVEKDLKLNSATELWFSLGIMNTYNRNNVFNFDVNTLQRVDQTPFFPYLVAKLSL